jgi:hypothetical protein
VALDLPPLVRDTDFTGGAKLGSAGTRLRLAGAGRWRRGLTGEPGVHP